MFTLNNIKAKRWNEYSLLEDQKYILEEILKIISYEKPDGIIIAGDVYAINMFL